MPSRQTKYARGKGWSTYTAMKRGDPKDFGVKTGQRLNTSKLRAEHGDKPWAGASPPRGKPKPKPRHNRGGGKEVKSNG